MDRLTWLDVALACGFLGSILFTFYIFSADPLGEESLPSARSPLAFRRIVIHEESSCRRCITPDLGKPRAHFLISLTGEAIPTLAWKEAKTGDGSPRDTDLSMIFESVPLSWSSQRACAARSEQEKALQNLVVRVRKEIGAPDLRVYQHSRVERNGCTVLSPARFQNASPLSKAR
jgi:hypothetical protein